MSLPVPHCHQQTFLSLGGTYGWVTDTKESRMKRYIAQKESDSADLLEVFLYIHTYGQGI